MPVLVYLWTVFSGSDTVVSFAAAAFVHEAGHIAAGLILRRKIEYVTLSALGADIKYAGAAPYITDLVIALFGPLFSLMAGALLYGTFASFSVISVIYGFLNLIPVPCFDGDRVLRCTLSFCKDISRSERICCTVNAVFLLIMYLFSVFLLFYTSFNASLLFICIYIFVDSYLKMKE